MQRQLRALVTGKLFSREWDFIHCLAEGTGSWVEDRSGE